MLDDRKLAVLRAIVEDYVSTTEPVGSKSLVDRHNLDVSPATIRNDMAVLEEQGYIAQPHTSAGRIPTDKGYRLFVDRLSGIKPLSAAERRAIETFLAGAYDLDDVVTRTVRLLAQLTRQVAVVQYPSLTRSAVRHIELVPIAPQRLLLVLITDTGRVEQRGGGTARAHRRGRGRAPARGAQRLPGRPAAVRGGGGGRRAARAGGARRPAERRRGALRAAGEPGRAARGEDSGRRGGQPHRPRLLPGPAGGARGAGGAGGADAAAR